MKCVIFQRYHTAVKYLNFLLWLAFQGLNIDKPLTQATVQCVGLEWYAFWFRVEILILQIDKISLLSCLSVQTHVKLLRFILKNVMNQLF